MRLGYRSCLRRRRFDPTLSSGTAMGLNQQDEWEMDATGMTVAEQAKMQTHYNAVETGLAARRFMDLFKP